MVQFKLRDAQWCDCNQASSSIERSEVQLPTRAEIWFEIFVPAPLPNQIAKMSALTLHHLWKIRRRGRGMATCC